MLIAEHDLNGKLWFSEYQLTPADRKRIASDMRMKQSAMFADRPDLWRKPQRKRPAPPVNQIPMFLEANPAYQPT